MLWYWWIVKLPTILIETKLVEDDTNSPQFTIFVKVLNNVGQIPSNLCSIVYASSIVGN